MTTTSPQTPQREPDLAATIQKLHGQIRLVIDTGYTPEGRAWWRATLSGEDFLNGPWSQSRSGVARSHRRAMTAASRSFTTRRRRR